MTTPYSLMVYTEPALENFAIYKVVIDDKNKLVETGTLTPDEFAMAKIIRYIFETHGGWPLDFTLFNDSTGAMGCPGIFYNLGGPKEVPSPNYMNIERATEEYNYFAEVYNEPYIPYSSPEQLMNAHNHLEDQLIENIKYKKDKRRELLNKIINTWNISTDGVFVHNGIDKIHENCLC